MTLLSPTWTAILYLVAAVCFILALKGLSSPKTARRGNLIGAAGAMIAVVTVFLSSRLENIPWILAAIAVGSAIAAPVARRVQMTQMPQLVALFNGVGGGAAALVALLELAHTDDPWVRVAIVFTLLVGAISFSGSLVTFAKLQELMTTRPVVFTGLPAIMGLVLLAAIGAAVSVVFTGAGWLAVCCSARPRRRRAARAAGRRCRRADRDLAAQRLHRPRGRGVGPRARQRAARRRGHARRRIRNDPDPRHGVGDGPQRVGHPVRRVPGRIDGRLDHGVRPAGALVGPEDVGVLLGYAQKVVIVPGYGLAVAQGQHTVAELQAALEARGIEVVFAIHPVAGRMPGHMNVLLAEANVPYESLKEMTEVNPEFKTADVALVVGANDVVNPAAKTTPGSPIYGMPILEVEDARQVVFLKRSMRPGFAGIENELLFEPQTTLLFGDAKDSLAKVLGAVKAL